MINAQLANQKDLLLTKDVYLTVLPTQQPLLAMDHIQVVSKNAKKLTKFMLAVVKPFFKVKKLHYSASGSRVVVLARKCGV